MIYAEVHIHSCIHVFFPSFLFVCALDKLFLNLILTLVMTMSRLLSIAATWSLSFMDFMHYLREISASLQSETSGSSQTWNCSGKLWCLESECLLSYTR